jgi:two-component system phosphate regulon sensor histidine kinase PhoR
MEDEQGMRGAVLLIQDITEMKQLEEVRKDFVANVSHELKTPLTSIQGFIETLQNGALENRETAYKFLNIIQLESDRLSRLINDILSLSELESGKGSKLIEKINLVEIVQETLEMMKSYAKTKQISIGSVFACNPIWIQANRDRVKQMLINLIDNAIKYTLEGGSVTVLVEELGDKVVLRVRDTGIGIAKEHIPRIFERFYRVDKSRSRSQGGTGLGLAIVKHIILSMKGRIEVSSELGKGSEFIIHIPKNI